MRTYKKNFIPLESDPDLFTKLLRDLGGLSTLQFVDLWTLEEIPERCSALILLFHDLSNYATTNREFRSLLSTDANPLWLKQTIHNACGLYAILHAACNGEARKFISPNSFLSTLINAHQHAQPLEVVLEESSALESAYTVIAKQGSTSVPDASDEVDHHYICFTRSLESHLWLLDGDNDGPFVSQHKLVDGAFLDVASLEMVRKFLESTGDAADSCAMMALVLSPEA